MARKSDYLVSYRLHGGKGQRRTVQLENGVTPERALDDIRATLAESHKLRNKENQHLLPSLIIVSRVERIGTKEVWEVDGGVKPDPVALPKLQELKLLGKPELMELAQKSGVEVDVALERDLYAESLLKGMTEKQNT